MSAAWTTAHGVSRRTRLTCVHTPTVAFWQGNAGMFWGLSLEDNLYVVSHSTAFVPIYLRDEILRAQPLAILYDHMT